jgi:hypothetical protein
MTFSDNHRPTFKVFILPLPFPLKTNQKKDKNRIGSAFGTALITKI